MKQSRVIQRLSGLLLALFLLCTAVWGHDGLPKQRVLQTKRATHVVSVQAKSVRERAAQSAYDQLKAVQFEAIVLPAPTVSGGSPTAFLLPLPTFMMLLLLSVPLLRHFTFPHYFFSYLQYVFGHAIAPNAP